MRTKERREEVGADEAQAIAATAMGLEPASVSLAAATAQMRVFQGLVEKKSWGLFKQRRHPVRAIDHNGIIRVQRSNSVVRAATAAVGLDRLRRLWEDTTIYNGDSVITPDMFLIVGAQVIDLSGVNSIDQVLTLGRSELDGLPGEAPIALISIPPSRGL
jgi:hypothetical protein